ncbi:hypothetical protein LWI29_016472, partial [Acer saccharum]
AFHSATKPANPKLLLSSSHDLRLRPTPTPPLPSPKPTMKYLPDLQFLKKAIIGHEIRGCQGRICTLDVGTTNVGISISSMDFKSSWPTDAFRRNDENLASKLRDLFRYYKVVGIIISDPKPRGKNEEKDDNRPQVRDLIKQLSENCDLKTYYYTYHDERDSTQLGKDEVRKLKNKLEEISDELPETAYSLKIEKALKAGITKKEFEKMLTDAFAATEIYRDFYKSVIEKNICQILLDEGKDGNIGGKQKT